MPPKQQQQFHHRRSVLLDVAIVAASCQNPPLFKDVGGTKRRAKVATSCAMFAQPIPGVHIPTVVCVAMSFKIVTVSCTHHLNIWSMTPSTMLINRCVHFAVRPFKKEIDGQEKRTNCHKHC
jgi:hypothetical protein